MNKSESPEKTLSKMRFYSKESQGSKKNTGRQLPQIFQKSIDNDDDFQINEKYLSLLKKLEKLCDSYELLPLIEFEESEVVEKSKTIVSKPKHKPRKDTRLNYLISQLKLRINNYPKKQSAYPAANRFKIISGTEEKVGPGTYKAVNQSKLESYEFSNIPRLHTPIAHTMQTIESLYKRRSDTSEDKIIKRNKILAMNPQQFREDIALKINLYKLKEKDARIKKQAIDLQTKYDKTLKLSEKIRKFEWRMTKKQIFAVQISWSCLFSIIGMAKVLELSGKYRRIRKIRWGKILRKFYIATKCLGKFLIILCLVRKKIVYKRITNLHIPMGYFVRQDILIKKKIVQFICDKTKDMPFIIHLMGKWKNYILLVQRNIRKMNNVNKARKVVLGMIWDKSVENIARLKMQDKVHKSMNFDKMYLIPNMIKDKFIRKYIKDTLVGYYKELKNYLQVLKNVKINADKKKRNSQSVGVRKPFLVMMNQKTKMNSYVEMAYCYKAKLEKKQRDIKYNITTSNELSKTYTRSFTRTLSKFASP
ncbi:hypothetical protein SteCoe_614 [Stentor coeruleus]|uniref:Uncharacterized protein n=1 Tax=Stentor coeruleus TaxID=5963 RepID=A0A1R2D3Q0_9CILI|nr:hypothetical protein SteCoe_614 [Stentor coeruleus]